MFVACNAGPPPQAHSLQSDGEAVSAPMVAHTPAPLEGAQLHLDLQAAVHLADYEQGGLSIVFGSAARMKYTVGHWKTGWGRDGVDDTGTPFTEVLESNARVYLPLSAGTPQTLRLRLKAQRAVAVHPQLNGASLGSLALTQDHQFADYELSVPAGVARDGENLLQLRFDVQAPPTAAGSASIPAVALVSAIRVEPQSPGTAALRAPTMAPAVGEVVVGGYQRQALMLQAPAMLSYYFEVPGSAKLRMRVGAPNAGVTATVRVTPEGGKPRTIWRAPLPDAWLVQQSGLEAYTGQVVRLDLQIEGEGQAGIAAPGIWVTAPLVAPPKSKPKSVVVLLVDTLRADHLRAYNRATRVKTPALDALAAQSVVFEAAQAPENWTKPSVASVLTGLYPASHGAKSAQATLSEKATLLSEVFKEANYATASFVANGFVSDRFGFQQGWDHYTNYIRERRKTDAEHVFHDAGKWIAQHKDEPFFVYIQTIDPHVPYDPPQDMLDLYHPEPYDGIVRPRSTGDQLAKAKAVPPKITFSDADRVYLEALYDAEISYHDKFFGVFIDKLKRLGLYDDVLLVVTADHGEELYDHQSYGHGHSLFQELIAVPLIVHHPGAPAARISETVSTVDIAPTVLSSVGLPVPAVMEGIDRMPQLFGARAPAPSAVVSDFLSERRTVRAGRWKLVLRGLTPVLFDLQTDPHELSELDVTARPIAGRYCRVLLGAFLGALDRGDWLNADPPGRSIALSGDDAQVDDATAAGLRALGYAN